MGSEAGLFMKKLLRVLDISNAQKKLFEENRIEDLLELQFERENIFMELKSLEGQAPPRDMLGPVARKIEENDTILKLNIEGAIAGIKGSLKKIRNGSMAIKAYTGR